MPKYPKPVVIVSKCLGFGRCRYDGRIIRDKFVDGLRGHVRFLPVCPEMEIGLGCPRPRIGIIETDGRRRLYQWATGRKLTARMHSFAKKFLRSAKPVDGFILKSRSPSCGLKDVKVFAGKESRLSRRTGTGFFARAVIERFRHQAIEDERGLRNARLRKHFLARVFVHAKLRCIRTCGSPERLLRFHAKWSKPLSEYGGRGGKQLDNIVADCDRTAFEDMMGRYEARVFRMLARPPRRTSKKVLRALGVPRVAFKA